MHEALSTERQIEGNVKKSAFVKPSPIQSIYEQTNEVDDRDFNEIDQAGGPDSLN
jgi:hypothetical protein